MILRPAVAGDAAAIAAILDPIIAETTITFAADPRAPAEIAAGIAVDPGAWRVAETEGIAGFARFGPFRPGAGYARTAEHSLYLAASSRRQGIGGALLAAISEAAGLRGIRTLVGAISAENRAARAFHARHGFVETGHLPGVGWKFGRALDLVLVQKALDSAESPPDRPDTGQRLG